MTFNEVVLKASKHYLLGLLDIKKKNQSLLAFFFPFSLFARGHAFLVYVTLSMKRMNGSSNLF